MKKIAILILALQIIMLPSYSQIEDTFVEKTLDKNLKIKQTSVVGIKDDFAEKSLDKNLKIKPQKYNAIGDSFAENNRQKNIINKPIVTYDENLPVLTKTVSIQKTNIKNNNTAGIPVRIKINQEYSTQYFELEEGDFIDFITTEEVRIHNKMYPAGSKVKGRIENISLNKSFGVPSEVIIGNFMLGNIPLFGEINKTGANRSLWLYPCVIAGCMFFGAGLLLIPIRGGHAKIKKLETFTLYADG